MNQSNDLLQPEDLKKLASIDSPTIANIIELFDCRSYVAGYTNHTIKAVYPDLKPIVGYAVTATFRSGYPASGGDAYGSTPEIIEAGQSIPEPRIIVIQDLDDPPTAATYGEMVATALKTFGYVGLITSGAGRDYEQVRELRFPCFVSSMLVAHGYCRFHDINVPVNVGGLRVTPGQIIHADANGVIQLPRSIAAAVASLIDSFVGAEQSLLDYLNSGQPTAKGLGSAFRTVKEQIDQIRQRVQSMTR